MTIAADDDDVVFVLDHATGKFVAPKPKGSSRALDAKLRRSMRNKARRNGDPMGLLDNNQGGNRDNLLSTYQRASQRNSLVQSISGDYSPEANKLRKQLQNHWYNRGENVADGLCDGKPTTKGKEKQRGKSIPLIRSFY